MEKNVFLKVNGVTDRHCAEDLESALEGTNGVKRIEVSLDDNVVDVQYESDEITVDEIKKVIEDQGLEAEGE